MSFSCTYLVRFVAFTFASRPRGRGTTFDLDYLIDGLARRVIYLEQA